MKPSKFNWNNKTAVTYPPNYDALLEKWDIPLSFKSYVFHLGLTTDEAFALFFTPQLNDLCSPYDLYDMEKSVKRIYQAIEKEEAILIYGDYDADGITSTTVLKEALEELGANVTYHIPDRFKEGYGPNEKVYQMYIDQGIQLIITVDNGVSGHKALQLAKNCGVDVIVTDHHELPEILPPAYSIIHPRHPKGSFPFKDLAGVGVSFKLACALLEDIPLESLELVAIGSIADLVPLVGENRRLVQFGLQQLQKTDRLGLQALCQVAHVSLEEVTEETIGFQLAPRLNAIGRLENASLGVALLSTFDADEALVYATTINEINEKRKELVQKTTQEALLMIEQLPNEPDVFVLAKKGWHEGILGIVAGKITQQFQKPTLILTIHPTTSIAKGSARSIGQFNIYQALKDNNNLFLTFGGHHMAAGLSLQESDLNTLTQVVNASFVKQNVGENKTELPLYFTYPPEKITKEFYNQLVRFAPFGYGNPLPKVLCPKQNPKNVKVIGQSKNHLKFQLLTKESPLDVLAFQFGKESKTFKENETIDLVGEVHLNNWNGISTVQFHLFDYQVEGLEIFDYRHQKIKLRDIVNTQDHRYLVFDQTTKTHFQLKDEEVFHLKEDGNKPLSIVLVDCPKTREELKEIVQKASFTRLYLYGYSNQQAYLNGLPTRHAFAKVFHFLQKGKDFDVRYKSKEMANFLQLSLAHFIFILQVFFDLEFVTIVEGILNVVPVEKRKSKELTESTIYQEYQEKMKVEEFLLYSPITTIKKWLQTEEQE